MSRLNVDIISRFLVNREGKINLFALLHSKIYLVNIQLKTGIISVDDITNSFIASNYKFTTVELEFHQALMFESSLTVAVSYNGTILFKFREELIQNDTLYTSTLLSIVTSRINYEHTMYIEEFKKDVSIYLSANNFVSAKNVYSLSNNNNTSYLSKSDNSDHCKTEISHMQHQDKFQIKSTCSDTTVEKAVPVVKFLAQLRKQGMDILFPQNIQDKVLACIYLALRNMTDPAHRDLIDFVIAIGSSTQFPELSNVSKTKIRGILAILKHADILRTNGVEGAHVKIFLAPNIDSFELIRIKMDNYLKVFCQENRIIIPKYLWFEIVWDCGGTKLLQKTKYISEYIIKVQRLIEEANIISPIIQSFMEETNIISPINQVNLQHMIPSTLNPTSALFTSFMDNTHSNHSSTNINSPTTSTEDNGSFNQSNDSQQSWKYFCSSIGPLENREKDLNSFSIPSVFDSYDDNKLTSPTSPINNGYNMVDFTTPDKYFQNLLLDENILLSNNDSSNHSLTQAIDNGTSNSLLLKSMITSPKKYFKWNQCNESNDVDEYNSYVPYYLKSKNNSRINDIGSFHTESFNTNDDIDTSFDDFSTESIEKVLI